MEVEAGESGLLGTRGIRGESRMIESHVGGKEPGGPKRSLRNSHGLEMSEKIGGTSV